MKLRLVVTAALLVCLAATAFAAVSREYEDTAVSHRTYEGPARQRG